MRDPRQDALFGCFLLLFFASLVQGKERKKKKRWREKSSVSLFCGQREKLYFRIMLESFSSRFDSLHARNTSSSLKTDAMFISFQKWHCHFAKLNLRSRIVPFILILVTFTKAAKNSLETGFLRPAQRGLICLPLIFFARHKKSFLFDGKHAVLSHYEAGEGGKTPHLSVGLNLPNASINALNFCSSA